MAEGGTRTPRIRMPKIALPTRSRGADETEETKGTAAAKEAEPAEEKARKKGKPVEAKAEAKEGATDSKKEAAEPTAGAKGKVPEPNLEERIEGLQGWMAEIERKQSRLTLLGIPLLLIAIAAAVVALYFGLAAKNDSATKTDVDALTKKVDALQSAATRSSKDTQNALNASAAQLQASISALQKQAAANASSIATLKSQASAGAFGKGAGAAAAALTPGAPTTTTTPKKP